MFKFGLKLWSTDLSYFDEIKRLYENNYFFYIELYAAPDSYEKTIKEWTGLEIPFIVHAPHFMSGMNLAKRECRKKNLLLASETFKFADKLEADKVIFHPGVEGDIKETALQLKDLGDARILIENKPYYTVEGGNICNGYSPCDIKFVLEQIGSGFCFDIGHAVCAANANKITPFDYIRQFLKLKSDMYHLTDGDFNGLYDRHDHVGKGSFPVKDVLGLLPDGSMITNEAVKDSKSNLDDFVRDIKILQGFDFLSTG